MCAPCGVSRQPCCGTTCFDHLSECVDGICQPVQTLTPTPTPTSTGVIIGVGDFCEPGRICPPPLLCLIDPPHQALVCSCVGDCDGNAQVTVDELLAVVNEALGTTDRRVALGDANSDGEISRRLRSSKRWTMRFTVAEWHRQHLLPRPLRPRVGSCCSAGPRDGQACNSDEDCAPTGVCVIAQGICNGGTDDGDYCGCISGTCTPSSPACDPSFTGTCVGGANADQCCDVTDRPPAGTWQTALVVPHELGRRRSTASPVPFKGQACLHDDQCPGAVCQSTGKFCCRGDADSFPCIDNSDCTGRWSM